ncbi:efflux RND transporter periplasmic adaptor subunit [Cohnella sp. JJ-181]|uniref:efflux RND transporter periplasmic adaptor subunit n=1 Tax=Cohnella rhizoplanae TaxID=2974897 RepID=UPI0022FF8D90|nr:biotin/lipoyl-binding protein [Cohnella sp. JJ-181]CAI6084778.1 hypothetical protein COHCIP112018_04452 [Cohnella sp. JJ-181]
MDEEKYRSRKRKMRWIAGSFVVLLAVLTLGGNTLRALSMPKIVTALPTAGPLEHTYEGSATIRPGAERELTNPGGWKVAQVLVKQGDAVRKGQTLVRYDDSEAAQALADQQSTLKKLTLSLEQLQYNVIQAIKEDDAAAKLTATAALETAKLEIDDQKRHIQTLQADIAANGELRAPFDGVVADVSAEKGAVSSGGPDIRLSDIARGYRIRLPIPGDLASTLSLGDKLDQISLIDDDGVWLSGTVTDIEESGDGLENGDAGDDEVTSAGDAMPMYNLTITLNKGVAAIKGGERVKVSIRTSKGGDLLLVPSKAVHQDARGAFVYTVGAKQGPLGNAYYVVENPVNIVDSNDYAIAVSGLFDQAEIIVDSTDFILPGMRVRY